MSLLFRSEEMCLLQLFFQTESALSCVNELGLLGLAEFRDLNPEMSLSQRRFVNEVKKCEEIERTIKYLEGEILRCNIPIATGSHSEETQCSRDTLAFECEVKVLEQELKEINCNHATLKRNLTELLEISALLGIIQDFLQEAETQLSCTELQSDGLHGAHRRNSISTITAAKLGFVAGVIKHDRFPAFEKVLWRLFHENFLLRHAEIQQHPEDGMVKKAAFIICVQGEQVQGKIRKICEGFRVSLYPCLNTLHAQDEMKRNIRTRIEELQMILRQCEEFCTAVLNKAANRVTDWSVQVHKMKSIYHTLNMCNIDITRRLTIAEIWCPVSDLGHVQSALAKAAEHAGSSVSPVLNRIPSPETPPTFNRTNRFTAGFQHIVDTYGVNSYQEVNPAPYTIVTFPFLFAVMFGDCGHGLVMTLIAAWIIMNEQKLNQQKNEIVSMLVGGRYIILLMGLFSIYTGLIYNDCFSKSFNILGSSWSVKAMFWPSGPWSNQTLHSSDHLQLDPAVPGVYSGTPYVLGIDPVWNIASNKLFFLNSYKMKMAVIMGVCHMTFGLTLSAVNYIYFRNVRNVLLRFVPELIFLLSLFGYLVFLILFKWCMGVQCDSSILLIFINMIFFNYQADEKFIYNGQKAVQIFLVVQALLMVPIMLLIKPLLTYRRQEKITDQVSLSDVFVCEAIHTVEHCLGCVSNTASYLRLWALSLAHSELSEVLWRMLMRVALRSGSSLMLTLIFCCFVLLSVSVLILMEGLSAFLHALRLHWVEFQNKFYKGTGLKFTPLSFKTKEIQQW
ncbi:V-type proton ATPase 116 kDa subunit a 1 isoform X1 [Ictalurus punctatus]|uniref:V-type proton ATPase subunit a n=2 Tax=Ictalurus punctatus TaxID=7998 RepID=A0A979EB34_ICTPU|nr:V-type proton ATPase 116 kDa subunit a 1 isoform X1 [Ictalurus punctatus]